MTALVLSRVSDPIIANLANEEQQAGLARFGFVGFSGSSQIQAQFLNSKVLSQAAERE